MFFGYEPKKSLNRKFIKKISHKKHLKRKTCWLVLLPMRQKCVKSQNYLINLFCINFLPNRSF